MRLCRSFVKPLSATMTESRRVADDTAWVQSPGVLAEHVALERIVFVPESQTLHYLNPSAAWIWDCLSQPMSVVELAVEISAEVDIEETLARQQVHDMVQPLISAGALVAYV